MDFKYFNKELVRLLEKNKLTQAELGRCAGISHRTISNLCRMHHNLGAVSFLKILRKGFKYSEKETRKIFLNAVERKYLD